MIQRGKDILRSILGMAIVLAAAWPAGAAPESRFRLGADTFALPLRSGDCDLRPEVLETSPPWADIVARLKPWGGAVLAAQVDCSGLDALLAGDRDGPLDVRVVVLPTREGAPLLADDAALAQFHGMKSLTAMLPPEHRGRIFATMLDFMQRRVSQRDIRVDCADPGFTAAELGLSLCGDSTEFGQRMNFSLGAAMRPEGEFFLGAVALTLGGATGQAGADFADAAGMLSGLRKVVPE